MRPLLAFIAAICVGLIAAYARSKLSSSPRSAFSMGGENATDVPNASSTGTTGADHHESKAAGSRSGEDATASLKTALSSVGRDSLQSESALYDAVQNLTAEDFQRLTRDPKAFEKLVEPLEKLWLVRRAFTEGFIERWLEVDESAAFAWFEARPEFLMRGGNRFDTSVIGTFARVRPESTLAFVQKQPEGEERRGMVQSSIYTVGETNLELSKEWIGRFEDKATREAAERGYRAAWAKVDPFGAIEGASSLSALDKDMVWSAAIIEAVRRGASVAQSLAEKAGTSRELEIATRALAGLDPAAAAQLITARAEKSPDDANNNLAASVGTEFAVRDLEQAREWADALPEKMRISALSAVTKVWAATDPQAAMEWIAAHPARAAADPAIAPEKRQDASTQVFAAWLGRDEAAARAYAKTLPAGETAEGIQSSLISYLTQTGRTAEAATLLSEIGSSGSGVLAGRVASAMSRDDPMAAVVWASTLPPGSDQTMAVTAAARVWAGRDPASVATWIEQFPSGEVRDRAIGAYTESISRLDPAAAAEWVMQVEDPWFRATTAQDVFWQMRQRDPSSAEAWLANLPGIDETIRRTLLEDSQ